MKKEVTINPGGNACQLDEDGYEALERYLTDAQLRLAGGLLRHRYFDRAHCYRQPFGLRRAFDLFLLGAAHLLAIIVGIY
jgi:hypothetical protein